MAERGKMMNTIVTDKSQIFTVFGLDELLKVEERIVIYGAGIFGKRIVDYIISVGEVSRIAGILVTEKAEQLDYKGIRIRELGDGEWFARSDNFVIIAVSERYMSEIVETVRLYGKRYRCITGYLFREINRKLALNNRQIGAYNGLDFLLAGFTKCGTTSIWKALMEVNDVYVPENKESLFFSWCGDVENPKEKLVKEYFNDIREGQIVGAIEPSFASHAGRIREFFGGHIKILFLVRNPADAMFSKFKMDARSRGTKYIKDAYQKSGGKYMGGVFEKYLSYQSLVDTRKYIDYISAFLECWPQEQIKIFIFEEIIANPQEVMNDILKFIGSSNKYMHNDLPWRNEGNCVMEDIKGLEIASRLERMGYEYDHLKEKFEQNKAENLDEFAEIEKQYNHAKKIYDIKMTKDERQKLEMYYNDSVRELEKLLDKDLSEIWF